MLNQRQEPRKHSMRRKAAKVFTVPELPCSSLRFPTYCTDLIQFESHMDTNIYSPPKSDLSVAIPSGAEKKFVVQNDYYVVAKKKFFLLYFSTFGLFQLYWLYKNWQLYKARTNEKIWPVMRAIFSIFFIHALFRNVDETINESGYKFKWNPSEVATTLILLGIASTVSDKLSDKNIGAPYTTILVFILLPFMGLQLHFAQQAINVACNDASGESNQELTLANKVWIGLGLIWWVMAMVGLYIIAFKKS